MCAGTHSGNKATCLCLFAQKRRRILNGAINLIFGCYIVSIALYLRNILSMLFPLASSSTSSDGIGLLYGNCIVPLLQHPMHHIPYSF